MPFDVQLLGHCSLSRQAALGGETLAQNVDKPIERLFVPHLPQRRIHGCAWLIWLILVEQHCAPRLLHLNGPIDGGYFQYCRHFHRLIDLHKPDSIPRIVWTQNQSFSLRDFPIS
jgi:hypothetical protein